MIQDALKTLLEADATVVALATGGVLLSQPSPATTPAAFDATTGRLLPTIYIEVTSVPQTGPYRGGAFAYFVLRCYGPTMRAAQTLALAAFDVLSGAVIAGETGDITWIENGGTTFLDRSFRVPEQFWPSRYRAVLLRGEE